MLLLAAGLALVAGFALQRGGICAVAAVRDGVEAGDWRRFLALLECAAWALGALLVADALGVMRLGAWPGQASLWAVMLGGALFGLGALVNGACAFGSAGRLAGGELSFLALLPGFVLGVAGARALGAMGMCAVPSALGGAPLLLLGAGLSAFALWRVWCTWRAAPTPRRALAYLGRPDWSPALAMAVIAFANVGLMLLVLSWPYTTLLVDLTLGGGMEHLARIALVLVFLGGAALGARTAQRFALRGGNWREISQRFAGGALMGAGAAMIPGGNDALVLLGMPLLQPNAFIAYGAMVAVIAAGFLWRRAKVSGEN